MHQSGHGTDARDQSLMARPGLEPSGRRPRSRHGCPRPVPDGETRTRTGDTTIFSRVLYQLSYLAVDRRS